MKTYYCWKCKTEMPFLDEIEWQKILLQLTDAVAEIQEYRNRYICDLFTAMKNVKPKAMKKFEELTGMPGIHFETIYHHRLSGWGPECKHCGHLLRTPQASLCDNCGKKPVERA